MSIDENTALAPINALMASMRFLLIATRETGAHHGEAMAQCVVEAEAQLGRVIEAAEQIAADFHKAPDDTLSRAEIINLANVILAACRSTGDSA